MRHSVLPWLGTLLLVAHAAAAAPEYDPARRAPAAATHPTRLIVKLRADAATTAARAQAASATNAVHALAARTALSLYRTQALTSRLQVLELAPGTTPDAMIAALARLRADPDVEYAEPDYRRHALAVPNDTDFVNQWYLQSTEASAVDAAGAWDVTLGSNGIVIADIDTGVRYEHPDLLAATLHGRLLPGYDFIAADTGGGFRIANDGDGRDPDPSDPGDWVSNQDKTLSLFSDCDVTNSSWHGTRVAGILGALTNNAEGVAGLTWDTYILPARVLGKCGGFDSDIIAAMLWSGGLHVSGVPDNPYPARVENLSLGSTGSCTNAYVDAVSSLAAVGVLVVAAAGNEGGPVGTPANCPGVVAVAGLRQVGTKVGFSSLGPQIALGAPGGNCVNTGAGQPCLYSIDTTSNTGTTTPGSSTYTNQFDFNVGTSFATPIVAGISALMLAVNGNLQPAQLTARLEESAIPFPRSSDPTVMDCHVPSGPNDIQDSECNCTTSTCGAGMANARAAVAAAQRPIAAIAVNGAVAPGQDVTLDASDSAAACGLAISSYAWSIVNGTGTISSGADTAMAVVVAPASGSYTVRVTVTDDVGAQDTADVVVQPNFATTSAPADARGVACPVGLVVPEPPIDVDASPHVGEDLLRSVSFALSVASPTPQDLTVTISDAATVTISNTDSVAGGNTVVIRAVSDTAMHTVFLQGMAQGSATLTVSAPGYQTNTQTVTVDPSGFVINGSNFSTTTDAANRSVSVDAARLVAGTLAFAETEALRPGVSAVVDVTSSDTGVGAIVNGVLSFDEGVSSISAEFDPLAAGTSTIAIDTPAGFDTPSAQQTITATVTAQSSSGGGGGGGGAFDVLMLCAALAGLAKLRRQPRH